MISLTSVDHVLNPNHDTITHSAIFSATDGNVFCVNCAVERYNVAPDFRRLALLEGVGCILREHGPHCLRNNVTTCLPMLLHGMDSTETGIARAATDILLTLKSELPDPVNTLASLISRTMSLGLPRASGHLYAIGQLLSDASQDRALAMIIADACMAGATAAAMGWSMMRGAVGGGCPTPLSEFSSFLASHAASASSPDHIKSDVVYVAMELLDCCLAVGSDQGSMLDPGRSDILPSPSTPGDDPFVSLMLAVPRLLARRSSCDEPLQLHSVAYIATATAYCRQRTDSGVPGWIANNVAGVPEVLAVLFDDGGGGHNFPLDDGSAAGGAQSPPGFGMCGVLKMLLMSSSYRVRTATARLITTLCGGGDQQIACDDICGGAYERAGAASGSAERLLSFASFFREKLIAVGVTDFIFEAIKKEQEGTLLFYLEAAEALSLSPVEFFHASNFSMKFAAPVLLGAARGRDERNREKVGSGGIRGYRDMRYDPSGGRCSADDDQSCVLAAASRLLLLAMVSVPPISAAEVVEEFLATAAAFEQSAIGGDRWIRVAADVLHFIASGDIPLPKNPEGLIHALSTLLSKIEEALRSAARMAAGYATPTPPQPSVTTKDSSSIASWAARNANSTVAGAGCTTAGQGELDESFLLQASRTMESLLHMVEEWALSGYPGLSGRKTVGGGGGSGEGPAEEPSVVLAELVFGSYERSLTDQHEMVAQSDSLTNGIAFASCVGAAIDSATSVLHNSKKDARYTPKNKGGVDNLSCGGCVSPVNMCLHGGFSSSTTTPACGGYGIVRAINCRRGRLEINDNGVHCRDGREARRRRGGRSREGILLVGMEQDTGDEHDGSGDDSNCDSADVIAAGSCLDSILTTAMASDLLTCLLELYTRCGSCQASSAEAPTARKVANELDGHSTAGRRCDARRDSLGDTTAARESSLLGAGDSTGPECSSTTRQLLAEVLQSLFYAHGWMNGLCSHDADRPVHARRTANVGSNFGGEGGEQRSVAAATSSERESPSGLSETVHLVLRSWVSHPEQDAVPFDHHVLSLLGTNADNGGLCKVALLLVSLSPSYLGVLHPHLNCRADSAVTILRYVKTVPEAVFCLNLFSHIAMANDPSGGGGNCGNGGRVMLRLDKTLAVAVEELLSRFSVADIAFADIPLSPTAMSFAIRAGCAVFIADWLVAAPLGRIMWVLREFGLPLDDEQQQRSCTEVVSSAGIESVLTATTPPEERSVSGECGTTTAAAGRCDEAALVGILIAAVRRWRKDLCATGLGNQQHGSCAEGTISRLSSVLLLAPDAFFRLAFGSGLQDVYNEFPTAVDTREKGDNIADTLAFIIPETLVRLSSRNNRPTILLVGDGGSGDGGMGGNNGQAVKIAFTCQVLRLASSLLHTRCLHHFYCSLPAVRNTTFSSPAPEETLARACGELLQGALAQGRKRSRGGGRSDKDDTLTNRAYLLVFNVLNALLVIYAEGMSHLGPEISRREDLASAFDDAHAAFAEGAAFSVTDRVWHWINAAPKTLAAYLQFWLLWNTVGPTKSTGFTTTTTTQCDRPGFERLDMSFDVLDRLLTSGPGSSVHHTGGVLTSNPDSFPTPMFIMGVRTTVSHVLAARCVESVAPQKPFSRAQVVSLQLALQGIACEGDIHVASAALHAIRALWEAYSGILRPTDLVEQPWNSFVSECCLENARSLLLRTANDEEEGISVRDGAGGRWVGDRGYRGQGSIAPTARGVANCIGDFRIDPSVLVSAVAALADYSHLVSSKTVRTPNQLRLQSGFRWADRGVGAFLSPTARACLYDCLALLAEDFSRYIGVRGAMYMIETRKSVEDGGDPVHSVDGAPPVNDNVVSCTCMNAVPAERAAAASRWHALGQLVHVLVRITQAEQPQPLLAVGDIAVRAEDDVVAAARRAMVAVLSSLHDGITKYLVHIQSGRHDLNVKAIDSIERSLLCTPLSGGTSLDGPSIGGASADSERVLLVQHDLWQMLRPPAWSTSLTSAYDDNPGINMLDTAGSLSQLAVAIKLLVGQLSEVGTAERDPQLYRANEQHCEGDER